MNLLRSLALAVFLLIITVPYALFGFLTFPFMDTTRHDLIASWTVVALWGARIITGIDYRIEGLEHLPKGAAILLAKHQSRWETIAIRAIVGRLCYVYKRELHWIPFFGWGIALCGMIPVNRARGEAAMEQVIRIGSLRLQSGWKVILFPEGTRVHAGTSRRYKGGGARLAAASGAPVIPIVHNAADCWPRDRFIKTPGTVTLVFGPPIDPAGMNADQINARVQHWIEAEMRRRFPHQYVQRAPRTVAA